MPQFRLRTLLIVVALSALLFLQRPYVQVTRQPDPTDPLKEKLSRKLTHQFKDMAIALGLILAGCAWNDWAKRRRNLEEASASAQDSATGT